MGIALYSLQSTFKYQDEPLRSLTLCILGGISILQVRKLRLSEVRDVPKVTQHVSDKAQDLNSKLKFLISRVSQVLST